MAHWKSYAFAISLLVTLPAVILALYLLNIADIRNASPLTVVLLSFIYVFPIFDLAIPFLKSPLLNLPYAPTTSFLLGNGPVILDPTGKTFLNWMLTVPNDGIIAFPDFLCKGITLLLTTPEAVMEVLNAKAYDYEKPKEARDFLHRVLGNGLVVSEGQEHRIQRKSVSVAFQGKQINALYSTFWEKGLALTGALSGDLSNGSGVVEINSYASRATLDVIGVAGLGRDFDSLSNAEDKLAGLYSIITHSNKGAIPIYFAVNMILPQAVIRILPWPLHRRIARAAHELKFVCRRFVEEKKASMEKEKTGDIDILSVLIKSGAFTDDQLCDQMRTFLAAGHETTSSAFTWGSYLLCRYPHFQERLRTELREYVSKEGLDTIDSTHIDSMPYLHAFVSETLRFYATVPNTARIAKRDTTILGQHVPKGTQIAISPAAMNLLPSLWGPDAGQFNPDRWLGEKNSQNGGAVSQQAFLTFIHGPRSCIGKQFAIGELKCLLAATVWRYHMELEDPNFVPIPSGSITIKPKGGLHVRLTEVKGVREK